MPKLREVGVSVPRSAFGASVPGGNESHADYLSFVRIQPSGHRQVSPFRGRDILGLGHRLSDAASDLANDPHGMAVLSRNPKRNGRLLFCHLAAYRSPQAVVRIPLLAAKEPPSRVLGLLASAARYYGAGPIPSSQIQGGDVRPNSAFKPKLHRSAVHMAGRACHVASYALQFGST